MAVTLASVNSTVTPKPDAVGWNMINYILLGITAFSVMTLLLLLWLLSATDRAKRYRSSTRIVRNSPPPGASTTDTVAVTLGQATPPSIPLRRQKPRSASRSPWKPPQPDYISQNPRITKADLSLIQLIKAGNEGMFYRAKMTRGTCKGHSVFTCKITREGVTAKRVETEVSIMRKLGHHKNLLQLLDWNTTADPCVLILEQVSCGTLRTFLQTNRDRLGRDAELQSLLTVAAYHVALAMGHLRAKMVVHCDLALRNIMVNTFPREVKVAEFGLARDLSRTCSLRSTRKRHRRERMPLRWYPPEFFRHNYYSFKGDVWAFGIVLWEMQTFGTLPYPGLESSEEVIRHVCTGGRNADPENCRPELLQLMANCWLDPHDLRPSFSAIIRILEAIVESDADYVDVDNLRPLAPGPPPND